MKDRKKMKEKISHGITFQGIPSTCGLILIVIGVITLFTGKLLFIAIPALCIGIILFLSIRGVIIDYGSMLVKAYLDLLFWKTGKWKPLAKYDRIVLKPFNESQTMNMASISDTFTTRMFDICLRGNNSGDFLLKEFTNYQDARSFLETYALKLKIESADCIKS
jgi:hypothetical protein